MVNRNDAVSRQIGDYYRAAALRSRQERLLSCDHRGRGDRLGDYERQIEQPVGDCLKKAGLAGEGLYIVTTMGVPLKVERRRIGLLARARFGGFRAGAALRQAEGRPFRARGRRRQSVLQATRRAFPPPAFPIYLVTRWRRTTSRT